MARTPIRYLNMDGLLNNGVSDFLVQDNEVTACKNVWVYKIGKLEKVPGYTIVDINRLVAGKPTEFLHHYFDTAMSVDYQIGGAKSGSDLILKYRTQGEWSDVKHTYANVASPNLSAQNFIGRVYVVGHDGNKYLDNVEIYGGSYTGGNLDLEHMPKAKYTIMYDDKLFVLNTQLMVADGGTIEPSRAYYATITGGGQSLTWDLLTQFLTVGPDDGDVITGAGVALDRLLIFKRRSVWKYDRTSVKQLSTNGCENYKSILNIGSALYWFNKNGFYRWRGAEPELISERAKEYIDAIDPSNFKNIVAAEYYKGEYRAFIGDVTVRGTLYKNAWFCFDSIRERCYIRCTFDTVKSASCYYDGDGRKRVYFSDNSGYLYKFAEKSDRVFSDNGHEIDSFFETRLLDHGVPEDVKFTNHMTVFTKNNYGMKVAVQADNEDGWSDNEDTIHKTIQQIEIAASANRFRYRFYEKGLGLSWEFEGFIVETQIKDEAYAQ